MSNKHLVFAANAAKKLADARKLALVLQSRQRQLLQHQ
jgi:hypothetical protein